MKINHRVPLQAFRSALVTPEYQARVDRDTSKATVAYEQAKRRLAAAELRQQKADERVLATVTLGQKKRGHLIREAQVAAELVELRREELLRLEAMMKHIPASVEHRGRKAYRPIPQPGSVL